MNIVALPYSLGFDLRKPESKIPEAVFIQVTALYIPMVKFDLPSVALTYSRGLRISQSNLESTLPGDAFTHKVTAILAYLFFKRI